MKKYKHLSVYVDEDEIDSLKERIVKSGKSKLVKLNMSQQSLVYIEDGLKRDEKSKK